MAHNRVFIGTIVRNPDFSGTVGFAANPDTPEVRSTVRFAFILDGGMIPYGKRLVDILFLVQSALGRVTVRDFGKHAYYFPDANIVQVENDEQRDARLPSK